MYDISKACSVEARWPVRMVCSPRQHTPQMHLQYNSLLIKVSYIVILSYIVSLYKDLLCS